MADSKNPHATPGDVKNETDITNQKKEQAKVLEKYLEGLNKENLYQSKSIKNLQDELRALKEKQNIVKSLAEDADGLIENQQILTDIAEKNYEIAKKIREEDEKALILARQKCDVAKDGYEEDVKAAEKEKQEATRKLAASSIAEKKAGAARKQAVKDADAFAGALDHSVKSVESFANKYLLGLSGHAFEQSFFGRMLAKEKGGMGMAAQLNHIGKEIKKVVTVSNVWATVGENIFESTMKMVLAENSGLAAFNKTTGAAGKYDNVLLDVSRTNKEFGLDLAETSKALMGLKDNWTDFTSLTVDSQKEMTRFAGMLEQVGISAGDTGKSFSLMTKTLGYSQQQAKRATLEVMKTAQGLGVSVGKMAADFAENMPRLIVHGDKAVQKFRELAAASKATGIAIGGLVDIAEKFDTFEGAADIVGQLNSVLGGNLLDSIKMVQETDPVKRLQMLQGALKGAGKDFKQLGYYMQKSLASTLTGGDVEKLGRIMSSDMGKYAAESQKAAMQQQELADAVHKSHDVMHKLHMLVNAFAVGIQPLVTVVGAIIDQLNSWDDSIRKLLGNKGAGTGAGLWSMLWIVGALTFAIRKFGFITKAATALSSSFGAVIGKIATFGKSAAPAVNDLGDKINKSGPAAAKSAIPMLAFGAAVLMIGAGIGLATLGVAQLAKAMQGLSGGAIAGLAITIAILVAGIVILGFVMATATGPFLAFGGAMLMIGGALFLIGAAVALVVWRFEKLAEAKGRAAGAMTEMFKASSAAGESFPRVTSAVEDLGDALSSLGVGGMLAVLSLTGFFASLSLVTSAVADNIKAVASSITEMVSAIQGLDIVKAFVVRAVIQGGAVPATGTIAGGTASPAIAGGGGGGAVELRSRSDNATATAGSGNSFNQLNISLNLNGRVLDQYIMDVVTKKLHPAAGGNR